MQIVIDQSLIDRYVTSLEQSLTLLDEAQKKAEALQKQAEANRLLTIKQACAYLGGISEDTLIYYRKHGLDYYKKGREGVWYRIGDIEAWLASGKVCRQHA